jgi:hypothetical protein
MNSLNDNKKSEAEKIAIEALLNASKDNKKSEEKIAIEALLNSSDSKERVDNNESNSFPLVVASLTNVRIIPNPNAIRANPAPSYARVLMSNNERQIR